MLKLLAISGSRRSRSSNTRLIERVAAIADRGIAVDIFTNLSQLPYFNPDEARSNDIIVRNLTQRMRFADGFLVSTPEYAHGVPGVLKNALDCLVGSDAFIDKPFSLLRAGDRSIHAPRSLIEILTTMSGLNVAEADITIDLQRNDAGVDEILLTAANDLKIRAALTKISQFIRDRH